MNPTLTKIQENLNKFNIFITENEFYPIQKAYTTPHFLVLVIRVPGKTLCLYIGRGNQYLGACVSTIVPPSFLRVQDKFLDFARSNLVGVKISKIELLENNKGVMVSFKFKTNTITNRFYIGYLDRELFFAKQESELVLESWTNQIKNESEVIWPESDWLKHNPDIDIDKYIQNETSKSTGSIEQKKREKFLLKKIANIKEDLKASSEWKEIEESLLSDGVNLDQPEIVIGNHKFKLSVMKSDWEKKDLIFKKIKKIKRGKSLLEIRLKESMQELEGVEKGKFIVKTTKEKVIQIIWNSSTRLKNKEAKTNSEYIEIEINGIRGWLGLNSSGNDHIRSLAHKDFYWFHVENYSGAHCILKTDKSTLLTVDTMNSIASILRDYSKLEVLEIPIVFTQVKNIKGVKGSKGKVTVKQPKYLRCPYRNWKEIITII